jgi:DNA-binding IclR family transcriptional regulator
LKIITSPACKVSGAKAERCKCANIPLPLASALDLESGETVTWKVLDRTHLLLVRLPERKQLKGEAVPQPSSRKRARRAREQRP